MDSNPKKPEEPEEISEDPAEKKPEKSQEDQKTQGKTASEDQHTIYVLQKLEENTSTFQRGDKGSIFKEAITCINNLSTKSDEAKFEKAAARLLSECARHPSQILCRGVGSYSKGDPCCFSHIVSKYRNEPTRWPNECNAVTRRLARQLCQKPSEDLDCKAVVTMINQGGDEIPSTEFKEAMDWLQANLELIFEGYRERVKEEWAKLVCDAADTYKKQHKGTRQFRPVQLAAILLYIRGFMGNGRPTLGQMQTGEGKTDVCAAIAAVLAKLHPNAAVHIITSSSDRASDDRKSTMEFFKLFLGEDRLPGLASEKLEWGNAGCGVFYAQITDIQKMVVNEIKSGNRLKEMYDWFKTCYAVIDECDHVLIEQATNQLYMSGPCPSFQELDPTIFLCQRLMDFDANFARNEVQTLGAVRDKAAKLVEHAAKIISEFETTHYGEGQNGKWPSYAPHKVDTNSALQRFSSSCLSARLKHSDEEYIVETEHEGGVPKRKVTIMDQSTGTESKASRWTHEAPFLEAIHGLPVDGVEPLAYFNSIVVMVQKYLKFAGVTGTLGQDHCRQFYDDVYGEPTLFRFPRNRISCLFQLSPQIANSQHQWLCNIEASVENYLTGMVAKSGKYGFPKLTGADVSVTGPVLIIVNSVAKAKVLVEYLERAKHKVMEMVESAANQEDNGQNSATPTASCIGSAGCAATPSVVRHGWRIRNAAVQEGYHVFPYYLAEHRLPDEAPNGAIFVASNKGGRGLDIKLDGACPEECGGQSQGSCSKGCAVCDVSRSMSQKSAAGSVLFVMVTDIMSDRQDRQAVGRCGRGAKPGIFQYQILKETTTDSTDSVIGYPLKDDMTIINDQQTKLSIEAGELQQKRNAIHEARVANSVMDDFALWKPGYVKKWVAKVFDEPKLSLPQNWEPQVQGSPRQGLNVGAEKSGPSVRASILQFLDTVVENRWKCWRDCGPPEREQEHDLDNFKLHQCLCDPISLHHKIADPFEEFACRLSLLANAMLLDAELVLELGLTLIRLGKLDPRFKSLARDVLEVASAKHSDWELRRQKQWQPEWTGTASLLLASLATQLPQQRPNSQVTALKALDDAASRIKDEIDRYKMISGVSDKFSKVNSDPGRKAKAFYAVQVKERINQLEYRKAQLDKAKTIVESGSQVKVKHQSQFNELETARAFKFMGPLWAKTVFAWGIDGYPLLGDPVMEIHNDGEWFRWIAGQESSEGPGNRHSAGGGGGGSGPNQEIRTEAANYEAEKEVALVINDMEVGAKEQQSTGSVAMPKMSIDYASSSHSISRKYSSEKSSVENVVSKVVKTTVDGVKNKVIELTGRANVLLVVLCEQVRAAFRMRTESMTDKKYEAALGEEFAETSQAAIKRMEELAYRKSVQASNNFSDKDVAEDVKHQGKGFKDQTRSKIFKEGEQLGSERINVRDDSLSEEDQYLNAQALLATMQYANQGSAAEPLRELIQRLHLLLSHWNARMQAAAESGNRADWTREEAEEMRQLYLTLQRRARNFMLRAMAKGNTEITAGFEEAYNNWKALRNQFHLRDNWTPLDILVWPFNWFNHVWQGWKAKEDVERFLKWGDCNKFNSDKFGAFNNMVMLDGVAQENGVHRQKLRRRKAVSKGIAAGWFVWFLSDWVDPTLIPELGSTLSDEELKEMQEKGTLADFERLQHLQDRANKDYYERHKQLMTTISWCAIGISILLALCAFINPLFIAAAICIIEISLAVLGLMASIVSAVVMYMQQKIEKDETLTQKQKEELNAILSMINSVTAIVTTITTLGIRGLLQKAVQSAKKASLISLQWMMTFLRGALLMISFQSLLQKFDRWLKLFGFTGRMNMGSEWYHDVVMWLNCISDLIKAASEQLSGFGSKTNQRQNSAGQSGADADQPSVDPSDAVDAGDTSTGGRLTKGAWSLLKGALKVATSLAGLSLLRDLTKLFIQQQQQEQTSHKQQEKEKEEEDESEFITNQDRDRAFTAELPVNDGKLKILVSDKNIHAKGKPASSSWFNFSSLFCKRQNTKSVYNGGKSVIVEWSDSAGKLVRVLMDLVKGKVKFSADGPMDLQLQSLMLKALGYRKGEHYREVEGKFVAMNGLETMQGQSSEVQPASATSNEEQYAHTFKQFFQLLAHLEGKDHKPEDVVFGVAAEAFEKLETHLRQEQGVRIAEHSQLKSIYTNQDGETETIIAGDQDAIDFIQGKAGAKSEGEGVKIQRFTQSPDRSLTDKQKDTVSSSLQVDLAAGGEMVTVRLGEGNRMDSTKVLSKPLVQFLLKLFNISEDKIMFDEAGNLIPNPNLFPGISLQPLEASKDASQMTKSFMQALQIIHFIRGMEEHKCVSKAKQDAEQTTNQALLQLLEDAASSFSKSSEEQKEQLGGLRKRVEDQVMEGFGFKEGVHYIVKEDGKMQALEIQKEKGLDSNEVKLTTSNRYNFADWMTILYLTLRKRHSAERAQKMLELTFQSSKSQDNTISTFVTEWGGKDNMRASPILNNASKQRTEVAKQKGTYPTNGINSEQGWTVKSLYERLSQWGWKLLEIRFGAYLAMIQRFGRLLKNFFLYSTVGGQKTEETGNPDVEKIIGDVWSGKLPRGERELVVLAKDLPHAVQVNFQQDSQQEATVLRAPETSENNEHGHSLLLEITGSKESPDLFSCVVKEPDGVKLEVDLGMTNDVEKVFRHMLFAKKLQQFREEERENAMALATEFAKSSFNLNVFLQNGHRRVMNEADLRHRYTASAKSAQVEAISSSSWYVAFLPKVVCNLADARQSFLREVKRNLADALQFFQNMWSEFTSTKPEQPNGAANYASTLNANQETEQARGSLGRDAEGNSETEKALTMPESKATEQKFYKFSALQELQQAITNDGDRFNAEVVYSVLRLTDSTYLVVNPESIPIGQDADKYWADLRWSDELIENGDEKGWVLNILSPESTEAGFGKAADDHQAKQKKLSLPINSRKDACVHDACAALLEVDKEGIALRSRLFSVQGGATQEDARLILLSHGVIVHEYTATGQDLGGQLKHKILHHKSDRAILLLEGDSGRQGHAAALRLGEDGRIMVHEPGREPKAFDDFKLTQPHGVNFANVLVPEELHTGTVSKYSRTFLLPFHVDEVKFAGERAGPRFGAEQPRLITERNAASSTPSESAPASVRSHITPDDLPHNVPPPATDKFKNSHIAGGRTPTSAHRARLDLQNFFRANTSIDITNDQLTEEFNYALSIYLQSADPAELQFEFTTKNSYVHRTSRLVDGSPRSGVYNVEAPQSRQLRFGARLINNEWQVNHYAGVA